MQERAGARTSSAARAAVSLSVLCALSSGYFACGNGSDGAAAASGSTSSNAGNSHSAGGSSGQGVTLAGSAGEAPVPAANGGSFASGGTESVPAGGANGGTGQLGGSAGGGNISGTAASAGTGGKGGGALNSAGAAGKSGGVGNGTDKITIWLAGDSTMANGGNPCPVGWGKQFQAHFNANAKVVNSAVGGTTVRSWLYNVTDMLGSDGECQLSSPTPQAHWTAMANGMKAGDYLFIQFGINDTTSATCPKHVSADSFKALFGMMAQAAKDKGAQPVFVTAVSSIACTGAAARGTRGGFAAVTKDAGKQFNVPVIDLEQLSVARYTELGFCPSTDSAATFSANTPIGNFFCADHTHFEAAGAKQIGDLVAKAIADQGLGLASYLVP